MAGIIDDLLNSALTSSDSPKVNEKRQSALDKTASSTGSLEALLNQNPLTTATNLLEGRGRETQGSVATDLQFLTRDQLRGKYGPAAENLLQSQDSGIRQYIQDSITQASGARTLADRGIDVGVGAVGAIGGIGALGISMLNQEAGQYVSGLLEEATTGMQSAQSEDTQGSRRLYESRQALDALDNAARSKGSLERIGRDALSAASNITDDPTALGSEVSQALGSLFLGGVIGRGVSSLAGKAANMNARRQAAQEAGDTATIAQLARLGSAGETAAMTGVIAGMESGGVYMDTTNRILSMSHEELANSSPFYRKMLDKYGDPERARAETADAAAKKAAAQMAPVAAGAGLLVSKFELNPIKGSMSRSLNRSGVNIASQTVEEAIQGGASGYLSNTNIQEFADENIDVLAGVGEGIGRGAVAGAGMTTVIQTPGIIAQSAVNVTRGSARAFNRRLERIHEENAKSSPIAPEKLAAASTTINASVPEIKTAFDEVVINAAPEQQEAASAYVQSLLDLGTFTEGQFGKESLNTITMDSKSKYEAIDKLAMVAADIKADPQIRLDAGLALLQVEQEVRAVAERDRAAFAELANDHPAVLTANSILGSVEGAFKNEEVAKVARIVLDLIQENGVPAVTEESVNTPKGQEDIQTAIQVAQVAPDKANYESNQVILAHEAAGRITLTPEQKTALTISNSLIQAERSREGKIEGLSEGALSVSKQITLEGKEKGMSIAEHAKSIYTALRNGDTELATQRLSEMGSFAQHMSNKVEALNRHIEAGENSPNQPYQAWNPKARKWFDAGARIYFRPNSTASVATAKNMAHEAGLAVAVYNNMVDALALEGLTKLPEPVVNSPLVAPIASPVAAANQAKRDELDQRDVNDQAAYEAAMAAEEATKPVQEPKKPVPVVAKAEPVIEQEDDAELSLTEERNRQEIERIQQREEEVEPEVEAVVKDTAEATTTVEPEPVTQTPQVKLEGMAAAFPTLINAAEKAKNVFLRSFKLPKEQRTRFFGEETLLNVVRDILDSSVSLGSVLGSKWTRKLDHKAAEAWNDYLKTGEKLLESVDAALNSYLHDPRKNRGTHMEQFLKGTQVNEWDTGLLLNIAEPTNRDGKESLKLNPALAETASLAAMNWLLNADRSVGNFDNEDIAKTLGIPEYDVTAEMYEYFNKGVIATTAIEDLGKKIISYWGVQVDTNGFIGDQKGLSESMARELLLSMEREGLLSRISTEGLDWNGKTPPTKFDVVTPFAKSVKNQEDKAPLLQATSTLLDELMLLTPDYVRYAGKDAIPGTSETQLRNQLAKLTKQQKQAMEVAQNVPFLPDMTMIGLYGMIGSSGVVELFNTPDDADHLFNKNHQTSVRGQNVGLVGAFQELGVYLSELTAASEVGGTDISETPTRFKYEFSAVNRLQMQGRYTPQSSKLMREAMLPTWSTLDLSGANEQHLNNFKAALAQGLDISIHKKTPEAYQKELSKKLAALAPAIELVQDLISRVRPEQMLEQQAAEPANITALKDAFKAADVPLSPLSLHAVVEYAKYQSAEDKSSFRTSLYLEADGMTNGPANAMMMLTGGQVTPEWVVNMERAGLYLNQPTESANTKNGGGLKDMYATSAEKLEVILQDKEVKKNPVFQLYKEFSKDLTFDDKGRVSINRNLIKNPLTVMIYGSGIKGVANKMTANLVDAIYERMSDALVRLDANPELSVEQALFPDASEAEAKARAKQMNWAFGALTGQTGNKGNLRDFTLSANDKKKIAESVRNSLAKPMVEAITATVGSSVMDHAQLIQEATSLMSQYASKVQEQLIQAAIEKNQDKEGYRKRQGLTVKQLRDIEKEASRVAALLGSDTQNYFISGTQSFDFGVRSSVGMDGQLPKSDAVTGLGDAGVKGIAYTVIGSGDGQMVQNGLMAETDVKNRQLPVFDGINTPVDGIQETGTQMNGAVWNSWNGNPLQMIADRFSEFLKDADLSLLEVDGGPSAAFIQTMAEGVLNTLQEAAEGHAVRMEVLGELSAAVDQMAATGNPLVRIGTSGVTTTDPVALANYINLEVTKRLKKTKPQNLTELSERQGKDGVHVVTESDLKALLNTKSLTDDQKSIIREAISNGSLKDWRILTGTPEKLAQFVQDRGVASQALSDALAQGHNGLTDPQSKLIMVFNGSGETLTHEILHASTIGKIFAYLQNPTNVSKETGEAILRTKELMKQFLALDTNSLAHLPGTQATSLQLQSIIQRELRAGNEAVAINEFMAWTLTNRELANQAKLTRASKLGQLLSDAWAALKTLLFGAKYAPKVGKDVYSNLRFNSAVIALQTPTAAVLNATSDPLAHESFGNDPRITRLENAFGRVLTDTLDQRNKVKGHTPGAVDLANEITLAEAVSLGMKGAFFDMTPQEQLAFNSVVAALATEAHINPQALREANRLFAHVAKELKVEDFLGENADESDRYYAQAKYNAVIGKSVRGDDQFGRSTILPAFIGLAMVNQEFRDVLAKMAMPKGMASDKTGIDGKLENLGYQSMEALGNRFTGTAQSPNILAAMDLLGQKIAEQVEAKETYAEALMSKAGSLSDGMNNFIVKGMEAAADRLLPEYTEEERAQRTKGQKALDGFRAGVATLISEKKGKIVAEGVSAQLDKAELSDWFRSLMSDFIGRTDGNKVIWDMVKQFRSKIQVVRQGYRDDLPEIIRSKFSRLLTEQEAGSMYRSMGKSELASLLHTGMTMDETLSMATDTKARADKITELEQSLDQYSGVASPFWIKKAKQLAKYMNTGEAGSYLLRNAKAIAQLSLEQQYRPKLNRTELESVTREIDQLTTLYSIENLNQEDKGNLVSLVQNEKEGMEFTLSYLRGQIAEERNKGGEGAELNSYKGYMPFETKEDATLKVADESKHAEMLSRGYVRLGSFTGSNIAPMRNKSYYFLPRSAKGVFNQGILQNVKQSAGGVDPTTGFTNGVIVHRYTDPTTVKRLTNNLRREDSTAPLLPVFDSNGTVIAYEQGIEPVKQQMVAAKPDLAAAIGKWRGRQVEEYLGQISNVELVNKLKQTYEEDIKQDLRNADKYEDLFASKDPVIKDAVSLMPRATRLRIEEAFDGKFLVQRGMIKDVVGYREATVGDLWTGNTRLNEKAQKTIRNAAVGIMGNEAYLKLTGAEKIIENLAINAKVLIVVKSVVVPAINIISNMLHLVSRGVPVTDIYKQSKVMTHEIHTYTQSRMKYMDAEAQLRAATKPNEVNSLQAQLQAIEDSNRRLSIWPLIQAGEYTSVSDADMRYEDLKLTSGKLSEYIDDAVKKLPDGVNTAGRYLMVSKDTALFNALQKSVEYGDFVSKAILYNDLVKRQGVSPEEALGIITEEFVSYDHLPGRTRGKLEKLGLLWFYNFKLRSVKVGMSTLRRNPLHTLLAMGIPAPTLFGNAGIPIEENAITMGMEGKLGYSIGPGQGLNSIGLNPWLNIAN